MAEFLKRLNSSVFFGNVNLGSTIFTPLLTTSYQKSYGGMYTATTDVYESAYASTAEGLLPSTIPVDELIRTGKLPQLALFTDAPVTTENAQLDALLAPSTDPLFSLGYGTPNLVTQGFRVSYLLDATTYWLKDADCDGVRLDVPNEVIRKVTPSGVR